MHRTRLGIVLFCLFVLAAGVFPLTSQRVDARETGSTCAALAETVLGAVKQACSSAEASGANSACLGYDTAKATFTGSASSEFKARGDHINLADIASLTTSAADPAAGKWGIATLHIQAGLPTTSKGLTAVLFGDASLTSNVRATDLPTLPVVSKGNTVLLRGGAGPGYPAALKLLPNQNAVVDGRNAAGDWLRVRLEKAVGWAYAPQVKVTGDVQSLTVLDETDTDADFLYKNPMQAFTLTTGNPATCKGEASSGLLLQLAGDKADQTAHLSINGADVELSSAILYARATPKDRLEIAAIAGSATITALGSSVTLNAGEWVRIRLGGKDGLNVIAAPTAKTDFPFAVIDGTPINALPEAMPCTVGLPADSKGRVPVRVGPGDERGSLFFMDANSSYPVKGWANDANGAPWWKIDAEGRDQAWVAQAAVHSLGACGQVAKADIPPVIAAPPPDTGNTGGTDSASAGDSGGQGFAPTTQTIWDVTPGIDKLVGDCANVAPINYCPSLVALTPRGSGLMYKGQELNPYYMARVRENVYAYSGAAPEALGPGRIKLTLVFTSQTTWTITRVLTLNEAPACQHVYTFTGQFLR